MEITHSDNTNDFRISAIDWLDNVRNTFFSNIFSRHSESFLEISQDTRLDELLDGGLYYKLCSMLEQVGSVCLKYAGGLFAPVAAIVKRTAAGIVLVKNPAVFSEPHLLSQMCHASHSFITMIVEPVQHWQQCIEPVQETAYSYY